MVLVTQKTEAKHFLDLATEGSMAGAAQGGHSSIILKASVYKETQESLRTEGRGVPATDFRGQLKHTSLVTKRATTQEGKGQQSLVDGEQA